MSIQPSQPAEVFAPAAVPAPESVPAPEAVPAPVVPAEAHLSAPVGGEVITLPSGFRVVLRGTRSVRNRDRAGLFDGVDFETGKAQAGFRILANILRTLIVAWDVRDFDDATGEPVGEILPIPSASTEDTLGYLSLDDAAALDNAAQKVQRLLMPNFEPNPDPASPTQPSAG
jgi:hypothetical protein